MHVSELKESKFLKKEDCDPPILVTIEYINQVNISKEGAPEELKWAVYFEESDKPMILNSTNGQLIAKVTESEDSDDWKGHKVVLFHDQNVSFGGKLVGGIRVRAPKTKSNGQAQKPSKLPVEEEDDNEPF